MTDTERITQDLAGAVGAGNMSVRPAELLFNEEDCSVWRMYDPDPASRFGGGRNAWVVWPGSSAEVVRVVQIARTRGLALIPYGGGTGLSGSILVGDDRPVVIVDLKRMDAVLDVDETSLVAHVQAGILGAELNRRLAAKGLELAHRPTSLAISTLGGWLSTHSAGLTAGRYGRIDDLCVAVSAVLPDGRLIRTRAAPRKATGPDFMHLFFGAEGLLGILTSAHVRVERKPVHRVAVAAVFATPDQAVDAASAAVLMGLRPAELAIVDPKTSSEFGGPGQWLLVCSFEGAVARAQADELGDAVRRFDGRPVGGDMVGQWRTWRWNQPFGDLSSRVDGAVADELDCFVPWDRACDAAGAVTRSLEAQGVHVSVELGMPSGEGLCLFVRWRDMTRGDAQNPRGRLVSPDRNVFGQLARRGRSLWDLVVQTATQAGAVPFHHRGVGSARGAMARKLAPDAVWMFGQVKEALDPDGIMNPWLWESVHSSRGEE